MIRPVEMDIAEHRQPFRTRQEINDRFEHTKPKGFPAQSSWKSVGYCFAST